MTPTIETFATSPVFLGMINDPTNRFEDGSINWDFVSADMHILLDNVQYDLDAMLDAAIDFYLKHNG